MSSSYDLRPSIFGKFINLSSSNDYNNYSFMSSFVTKTIRWSKNYLLSILDGHLIHYPSPLNLTYAWSFGSSAGICLIIQILSGIFLAMHYTPHIDLAFSSVEHIMRDVNNGWLIRYIHANGASMFFIVVYCLISWPILRLLHAATAITLVFGCSYFYFDDGNSLYGVRTSLRPNELLGRHCYY